MMRLVLRTALLGGAALLLVVGCKGRSMESRAREAAERMKESMPDVESKALAQKTTPEQVKEAQQALKAANEYQGEVTGTLDPVTVNSIEAFQRAHGLTADGILNGKTRRVLQEASRK